MPKKIQLSIPVPCHENWDAMTPVDKGKFCGSCQKQVVDFSTMSDRQVAAFFKKPSTGSVCGRFMTDQLDREMEIPRKRIPWLKYFFTIALPAFFMSARASAERTQGKIRLNTITNQKPVERVKGEVAQVKCKLPVIGDTVIMPEVVASSTLKSIRLGGVKREYSQLFRRDTIRGKVIDATGNAIPQASIIVKGTKIGTTSNQWGEFELQGNKTWTNLAIQVSCIGFETQEMAINQLESKSPAIVTLRPITPEVEMMGVIVITRCFPKASSKPVPLMPNLSIQPDIRPFRLYPNPLPSGSALTIECKEVDEGYYTLQLVNAGGQAEHQQELWIDSAARLLSIAVPVLKAGSYFLVMTHQSSGKKFTEKIIIQ